MHSIVAKTTFAIIDYVIDERHCCPRVNHGKCYAAVRHEGASGSNIRNRDEYHRCYGSLSQASRNIENCKLEMLKISIQRGFKYPQGSWVLASARRLVSGLTVTKTSDRIPVAWPLHLSVKWEIKYELLVRCINSWQLS